jgi:hypothetical protein
MVQKVLGVPSNLSAGPQGDCNSETGCLQWRERQSMILAVSGPEKVEPRLRARCLCLGEVQR